MNTNKNETIELINAYSCCGSSWMSVLSDAVKNGILTDEDIDYPQVGDYNSYHELGDAEGEKWLEDLHIRLSNLGLKLVELPAPGCMQHPGDGDAWVLAQHGQADNDKIDALRVKYERMYISNQQWYDALYR